MSIATLALALALAITGEKLPVNGTCTLTDTGTCPASSLATTMCLRCTVHVGTVTPACVGHAVSVPDLAVTVKFTRPSVTQIGDYTIEAGAGATGFEEATGSGAVTLLSDLVAAGIGVLQVAWDSNSGNGYLLATGGPVAAWGGRFAALDKALMAYSGVHVAHTPHVSGGNSGGGLGPAIALTHFGSWDWTDCVLPTSWPICQPHACNTWDTWWVSTRAPVIRTKYGLSASAGANWVGVSLLTLDQSFTSTLACENGAWGYDKEASLLCGAERSPHGTVNTVVLGRLDNSSAPIQGGDCADNLDQVFGVQSTYADHDIINTGPDGGQLDGGDAGTILVDGGVGGSVVETLVKACALASGH
jgi:hypothetical protein